MCEQHHEARCTQRRHRERRPRRKTVPRLAVAAHMVEVPQAQAGGRERVHHRAALRDGDIRRVHRSLRPARTPQGVRLCAADASAHLPRRSIGPALRLPPGAAGRRGDVAPDLCRRPEQDVSPAPLRSGRRVLVLGAVPGRPASVRSGRRRGDLSPWNRSARPGHALPHPQRRPDLAIDRVHRCGRQLPARAADRRRVRVLRRHRGRRHSADHRDHPLLSRHPAVDGLQRRPGRHSGRRCASTSPSPSFSRWWAGPCWPVWCGASCSP